MQAPVQTVSYRILDKQSEKFRKLGYFIELTSHIFIIEPHACIYSCDEDLVGCLITPCGATLNLQHTYDPNNAPCGVTCWNIDCTCNCKSYLNQTMLYSCFIGHCCDVGLLTPISALKCILGDSRDFAKNPQFVSSQLVFIRSGLQNYCHFVFNSKSFKWISSTVYCDIIGDL